MTNVGFHSGNLITDLGPDTDMMLFFNCLQRFAVQKNPEQDWSILTDRFYKRYIRREEMEAALILMDKIQGVFTEISTTVFLDTGTVTNTNEETGLDFKQNNLALLFNRYFETFKSAIEEAKMFEKFFKTFQPVRILPSDMGPFLTELNRPLEETEALSDTDLPFWLRYGK